MVFSCVRVSVLSRLRTKIGEKLEVDEENVTFLAVEKRRNKKKLYSLKIFTIHTIRY